MRCPTLEREGNSHGESARAPRPIGRKRSRTSSYSARARIAGSLRGAIRSLPPLPLTMRMRPSHERADRGSSTNSEARSPDAYNTSSKALRRTPTAPWRRPAASSRLSTSSSKGIWGGRAAARAVDGGAGIIAAHPFRVKETKELAQGRKPPGTGARRHAAFRKLDEVGADGDGVGAPHRPTTALCKLRKGLQVAAIGFEGVAGGAALGGQHLQKSLDVPRNRRVRHGPAALPYSPAATAASTARARADASSPTARRAPRTRRRTTGSAWAGPPSPSARRTATRSRPCAAAAPPPPSRTTGPDAA